MDKAVEGLVEVAPSVSQWGVWLRRRRVEIAKSGLEDTGIAFGEEEGEATARRSSEVMVAAFKALNEAFASESAQVIGHLAGAVIELAEMGSYQLAQGSIGEAVGEVAELAQAGKECHDTGIAEAEAGSTLAVNERRQYDLLK